MSYRVFVGNIPNDTRERDIEKFFKGYGKIHEVVIKNGFAFADFDDKRDADDAVHDLHGSELLGVKVIVDHAVGSRGGRPRVHGPGGSRDSGRSRGGGGGSGRGPPRHEPQWLSKYGPPNETPYRVLVENLSTRVSWQDLKDFMRQAGDVTYADAHRPREHEGVVCFTTKSEMKRAVDKLDGTELNGRKIRLIEDYRGGKSASRSRSRSPASRSRSRSSRRSKSRSRSPASRSRSRSHS